MIELGRGLLLMLILFVGMAKLIASLIEVESVADALSMSSGLLRVA